MRVMQPTLLLVLLLYVSSLGVSVTHGSGVTDGPENDYKALEERAMSYQHDAAHMDYSASSAEWAAKEAEKSAVAAESKARDLEQAAGAVGVSDPKGAKAKATAARTEATLARMRAQNAKATALRARADTEEAWAAAADAEVEALEAAASAAGDSDKENANAKANEAGERATLQRATEARTAANKANYVSDEDFTKARQDVANTAEKTTKKQTDKGGSDLQTKVTESPGEEVKPLKTEEELNKVKDASKEPDVKNQGEKTISTASALKPVPGGAGPTAHTSEDPVQGAREGKATLQKDTVHQANTGSNKGTVQEEGKPVVSDSTKGSKGQVTLTSTDDSSGADRTPQTNKGQGEARDSGHTSPVKPGPSDGAQETRDTVGPTSSGETPKDKTPVDTTDKGAKKNNPVEVTVNTKSPSKDKPKTVGDTNPKEVKGKGTDKKTVAPKVSVTVPPMPVVNKTTTLSATAISSTIPAVLITSVVFLYLYK